jgi:WD40 repeat protein
VVAGLFEGHTDWVRSVGFSPDGKRVISSSDDKTLRIWDSETGGVVAGPFEGYTEWI